MKPAQEVTLCAVVATYLFLALVLDLRLLLLPSLVALACAAAMALAEHRAVDEPTGDS